MTMVTEADEAAEELLERRIDAAKQEAEQFSVVLQSAGLPEDHMILEGIDTSEGPLFSVTEAGKVFFGRSGHWIRWRERDGALVLDGVPVGRGRRAGKKKSEGYRSYSLTDIEQMTHALCQNGAIDGAQLLHALRVVQSISRVYGHLPPEYEVAGDEVEDVGAG